MCVSRGCACIYMLACKRRYLLRICVSCTAHGFCTSQTMEWRSRMHMHTYTHTRAQDEEMLKKQRRCFNVTTQPIPDAADQWLDSITRPVSRVRVCVCVFSCVYHIFERVSACVCVWLCVCFNVTMDGSFSTTRTNTPLRAQTALLLTAHTHTYTHIFCAHIHRSVTSWTVPSPPRAPTLLPNVLKQHPNQACSLSKCHTSIWRSGLQEGGVCSHQIHQDHHHQGRQRQAEVSVRACVL